MRPAYVPVVQKLNLPGDMRNVGTDRDGARVIAGGWQGSGQVDRGRWQVAGRLHTSYQKKSILTIVLVRQVPLTSTHVIDHDQRGMVIEPSPIIPRQQKLTAMLLVHALRTPLSVRLSVCHIFLTMFFSSYHHEIFRSYYHWQKWCPCKRSRSEVEGQGHRGQNPI